jgi:hypothetical protein
MGIGINVESIITPKKRHNYGPPNYQYYQRDCLHKLCEAMKWEKVPWEDPSEIKGIQSSCDNTKYYALLGIARSIAKNKDIEIINEDQLVIDPTPEEKLLFPHLLLRVPETNLYLPVDFELPVIFKGPNGIISAGSSYHFVKELSLIKDRLSSDPTLSDEFWTQTKEKSKLLLDAANQSIAINLPLKLMG